MFYFSKVNLWQRELRFYFVAYRPIARQRLGKHIPAGASARNRTSTARHRSCKHSFPTIERLYFLRCPCKVVIKKSSEAGSSNEGRVEFRDAGLPGYELGICMCDLKRQWDCYKAVARIRLVKTENTGACVTVNCKVYRSAIALYCLQTRVLWIRCQ
jgi:hypothetical protein